jgi:hypothetical protein
LGVFINLSFCQVFVKKESYSGQAEAVTIFYSDCDMSFAELLPGGKRNIGDMLTGSGDPIDFFGRQDGVGRFVHPETGMKIVARRGEVD